MKQTEVQKCIAEVMETEKRSLFCYACYYLGDADEAHDMLQDLYLSLCGTTGIVQNTRNLKNYIFRALYNNCKAAMKRKQNICISSIDSTDVSMVMDFEPRNFEQEYMLINKMLNLIPEEQSEVIRLHIHGEKTFHEISEILSLPEASVKSRYRYGIEKLRKMINKDMFF